MINRETLEGNWNELKGQIQKKWGNLSDSDVAQFHGNVDELIGTIQRKTGEGREAVERYLQELSENAESVVGQAAATARQYAHQATDYVRDSSQRAADQMSGGIEDVRCLVRDHPGQTLAICFGAGLVVGLVIALSWRCK
jgi:uncharacterized protein YjbJ (UPF0337 family)